MTGGSWLDRAGAYISVSKHTILSGRKVVPACCKRPPVDVLHGNAESTALKHVMAGQTLHKLEEQHQLAGHSFDMVAEPCTSVLDPALSRFRFLHSTLRSGVLWGKYNVCLSLEREAVAAGLELTPVMWRERREPLERRLRARKEAARGVAMAQ